MGGQLLQSSVEILLSKHLPPGGFRRGTEEIRLLKPSLERLLADGAAVRQRSIQVERVLTAAEAGHRQVHQGVGRPAIPSQNRVLAIGSGVWRDQRDVGDSTQIQESSPAIDATHERGIGHGNQGCALASKGKIGGSEVVDHRSAAEVRQEWGLEHLPTGASAAGPPRRLA